MENQPRPTKLCNQAREQAERLLSAARSSGDRLREASALTDLGVVLARAGDFRGALGHLEESLGLTRQLECPELENDIRLNLGLTLLGTGQIEGARTLLEQQVAFARESGDLYQEKIALDYLAAVCVKSGAHARAVALYERAVALADKTGDRQHQADLLWMIAIQHAELSQRDQASAVAESAIELYKRMKNPHVTGFADSLRNYLDGAPRLSDNAAARPGAPAGGYYTDPTSQKAAGGTGILWKALTAAQSFAKFLASGFKTVSTTTHKERLKVCETCLHHTGVRCKLCGCFTTIKAWMPHEECPAGKWPLS
jgi:tetratricopeptide (TPR) repeat protein